MPSAKFRKFAAESLTEQFDGDDGAGEISMEKRAA